MNAFYIAISWKFLSESQNNFLKPFQSLRSNISQFTLQNQILEALRETKQKLFPSLSFFPEELLTRKLGPWEKNNVIFKGRQ